MRKKRIIVGLLLALLLMLAACAPAGDGADLGALDALDLTGERVDASIFKEHKLTMVNIWATYCSPCISEMPALGELNDAYAGQGFQVVGIVTDVLNRDGSISMGQLQQARQIISTTGADYQHLLPSESLDAAKLNAVSAVPETFCESGGPAGGAELSGRPGQGGLAGHYRGDAGRGYRIKRIDKEDRMRV